MSERPHSVVDERPPEVNLWSDTKDLARAFNKLTQNTSNQIIGPAVTTARNGVNKVGSWIKDSALDWWFSRPLPANEEPAPVDNETENI